MCNKKLEYIERQIIMFINHCISKQIMALARHNHNEIRMEDFSGILNTSRQHQKTKSNASNHCDLWLFFQLETFVKYKAILSSVAFENIPALYISKTYF
jgi:hypothetical protein